MVKVNFVWVNKSGFTRVRLTKVLIRRCDKISNILKYVLIHIFSHERHFVQVFLLPVIIEPVVEKIQRGGKATQGVANRDLILIPTWCYVPIRKGSHSIHEFYHLNKVIFPYNPAVSNLQCIKNKINIKFDPIILFLKPTWIKKS